MDIILRGDVLVNSEDRAEGSASQSRQIRTTSTELVCDVATNSKARDGLKLGLVSSGCGDKPEIATP